MNFETNFYTERDEFTRAVTLLGRRVELRIWPASFGWRFGDGHQRTTTPGAAYPDLEITHEYLERAGWRRAWTRRTRRSSGSAAARGATWQAR